MRKDRDDESFDIVWETVASFFSKSEGLGSAKERERATRTDAQIQHLGRARGGHNPHQVVNYGVVYRDIANCALQLQDVLGVHHRLHFVQRFGVFTITQD